MSQTGLSSFILADYDYLGGVGAIYLDTKMIPYCKGFFNGGFSQFLPSALGHFADINCSLAGKGRQPIRARCSASRDFPMNQGMIAPGNHNYF